ncbi:glucosamine/galactosamine-6-phosphate isomerase [Beutenbergia cavernae DSM 12333]|uniref:Glucosamine/galactosamine-6-phosphate isomerase n=1 Tax=Beutenbergia cavernae (strain ATCC BAA-8 / DSM 12333 / CCUG 43141 / JCM 11478 / NBRC 16432 / NCIMB 13614 / HKI 0122) TaxID=471853 RepID=C5C1I6_BEUC1|nr:glucosamine-6-phosphate deaminase [Beutenbergia cavernae]ACQ81596.1 glucosamine/galactosamine-6-phosphate isomerase [Beutenbergia cavernae DSM 12333]
MTARSTRTPTGTPTDVVPGMPRLRVFETRAEMGAAASSDVAAELRRRLATQERVRMVFAAAPSQREVLEALVAAEGIDWTRVEAFHMDEYLGLPADAPERFAAWLREAIFGVVPFAAVHAIEPGPDPERTAQEYAAALAAAPIDVVCLGIGQNGHLAFNDPPVADLADPLDVKVVELDDACRQQQVDDECFPTFDDVPTHAITLTVPRLLAADRLFCVVPGPAKRAAVEHALTEPVSAAHPATALRTHPDVTLYVDADAAPPAPVREAFEREGG